MSPDSMSDYRFSAIVDGVDEGEEVGAVLTFSQADEMSDKYLNKVWERLASAVKNHHFLADDGEAPAWTGWQPHNWSKQPVPNRQKFIAWHGKLMAGFVNLQPGFASPFGTGARVMYIEHMMAFPGNLRAKLWNQRLRGVGVELFSFSVVQSLVQGLQGIVGLHVADGATGFYEKLPEILGFPVFSPVTYDVDGPHPNNERSCGLPYLETTPEAAAQIIESHHV